MDNPKLKPSSSDMRAVLQSEISDLGRYSMLGLKAHECHQRFLFLPGEIIMVSCKEQALGWGMLEIKN